ncbi:D-TA family PLP-dependent enzyme [Fibrella sp. HMF5335]|uniref:D-TA family PLP-dependent enzyme n=1 Tax=Fibrella rubiginis TaxID=2817060 RepID=A0A939GIA0_9BACT|nr:D-TA family PLP-dependent enzyme [Fibrella rubiginis]MBO0936947.1 D-TA family PLP-dependent enzyme [Fibrella rubiginis]
MLNTDNWFTITNPTEIDSPALLVYPERVKANIQVAIELVGGADKLRPHVKTHKMRTVTELLLAAGIHQFKCATIAEAEMLAQAGAPDVLLAYPVVGPKATRLRALTDQYPATRFSCLVDSIEAVRHVEAVFVGKSLDVYIDLNVGMNRTGILPEKAVALFGQLTGLTSVNCVGLHAYDGHIHATDILERTQEAAAAYALAEGVRQEIEHESGVALNLVIGGSPTFATHAKRDTERLQTSPGTFVFWDAGYAQTIPELPLQIAAALLTRVVSVVDDHTLTLDLGYKAVASESPLPRVIFPQQSAAEVISQNEEHLIVRVPDTRRHDPGEVWYAIPIHICPTVALYEKALTVENGHVSNAWPVTARNR